MSGKIKATGLSYGPVADCVFHLQLHPVINILARQLHCNLNIPIAFFIVATHGMWLQPWTTAPLE